MEKDPLQRQSDSEPQGYLRVARFSHEQPAGRTYFRIQQALFRTGHDNDVSAFRFRLNQVWHVAVLGDPPPTPLAKRLEALLSAGEPATLPEQILDSLKQRRAQVQGIGHWVEGHYRPGRRM